MAAPAGVLTQMAGPMAPRGGRPGGVAFRLAHALLAHGRANPMLS